MEQWGWERIAALVSPYLEAVPGGFAVPDGLYPRLTTYLELLLRWNARTNLTAIREPGAIVQRHFGESLFAAGVLAGYLPPGGCTMLDLGSGAGFPGIPAQLLLPRAQVTLAESQGKKAAFLREAVRALELPATVWAARAESLPAGLQFDAVMLRAVDRMAAMVEVGRQRVRPGGVLLQITGEAEGLGERYPVPERDGSFVRVRRVE